MIHEGKWVRRTRKKSEGPPEFYHYAVPTGISSTHRIKLATSVRAEGLRRREMIAWCREQFGESNDRWNQRMMKAPEDRELYFLFRDMPDAMGFLLRWR